MPLIQRYLFFYWIYSMIFYDNNLFAVQYDITKEELTE